MLIKVFFAILRANYQARLDEASPAAPGSIRLLDVLVRELDPGLGVAGAEVGLVHPGVEGHLGQVTMLPSLTS